MAGKRNFGSVRKLPSGRWQARYWAVDGRRITARSTFATKADATLWLDRVRTERASGHHFNPAAGEARLRVYVAEWLDHKAGLAPRTHEIYESQLRLHVLPVVSTRVPALGDVRLVDLSPKLIAAWYNELRALRGEHTAAKAYVRLRQVLAQAVMDDRLAKNPCRIERGGVERHAEQRFVTVEELYALADVVPLGYRALVLTAGLAGLRMGELRALRRDDIDLDGGTIAVRRQRVRLASGREIEGRPKSAAGVRVVYMPKRLQEELLEHLDRLHLAGRRGEYVFTQPTSERPLDASNFRFRVWLPAVGAVGADGLRFHDLRHTAGTLAARTGATTKELMARLGHSSHQAAMVYQHAAAERDQWIASGLDVLIDEAGISEPGQTVRALSDRSDWARSGHADPESAGPKGPSSS
ncbi:MAG: tyrosine-type recombinase/integrase [Acidimicrobiales bacterium]